MFSYTTVFMIMDVRT